MGWKETLETLKKQFEAKAAASRGLHHLMVEVSDDERERMSGPDWFQRECDLESSDSEPFLRAEPWCTVQFSGLPIVHPRYREIRIGEDIAGIPTERVVRDLSGTPRAIFEPMRLRSSYLCGDHTALSSFESLADAASRVLTELPYLAEHEFAADLTEIFRAPRGGIRYVFGDVPNPPPDFIAKNWQGGRLVYDQGVLIDVPIAESPPGPGHWLLLLHRLSWRRILGSPLQGQRHAWHKNTSVPYEWVLEQDFDPNLPRQWRERFSQIPTSSYYSILGEQARPLDVNLASTFAIDILLTTRPLPKSKVVSKETNKTDYTKEPWHKLPLPPRVPCNIREVKKLTKPKIALMTATTTERDAVLKRLEPLDENKIYMGAIENNTYFVGRLGEYPVVLCMCSMGAVGRDAAQIVSGEVIRFWKPSALIMVGIAFGKDCEKQKIGDVLVSERIVAYEPERVGIDSSISRGQHFLAGARLLDRFRNFSLGWDFRNPSGVICEIRLGAILSGEKLVDNPDFKAALFDRHPYAIGGEMEGIGLAASAERERCEWILVKGICDWADGNKSDEHQAFAAASSVSLVQHVLSQPHVIA